jgi:hypothetical protein
METITTEVGTSPRVRLPSVGGDLRVVGRSGGQLEAQAPARGDLTLERQAETVVITSRVGCLLFVPAGARVEVGAVGGDARLSGLEGEASLETVGGDVNLRSGGAARLGRVAGDLRIVGGRGALAAGWIGGDVRVENLEADLRLDQVEGDLYVRNQRGAVRATAGGDVHAELSLPPGTDSRLESSGDLICRLPPESSVSVSYRAAGEARVALPLRDRAAGASGEANLGAGEAALDLVSGGDLRLELIGRASAGLTEEWRQDLEARIEAEVEAALSDLERSQPLTGILRQDVAARIRASMARARRRPHRLGRAAERPRQVPVSLGEAAESGGEIGDEERLAVLRLLEAGKLTVEQAEQLFRAMEGGT